jgi:hypothetical protein
MIPPRATSAPGKARARQRSDKSSENERAVKVCPDEERTMMAGNSESVATIIARAVVLRKLLR